MENQKKNDFEWFLKDGQSQPMPNKTGFSKVTTFILNVLSGAIFIFLVGGYLLLTTFGIIGQTIVFIKELLFEMPGICLLIVILPPVIVFYLHNRSKKGGIKTHNDPHP